MAKTKTYVAKTLAGLESLLVDELKALGFQNVTELRRGAEFETDDRGMILANMASRYAIRVLEPFWEDKAANPDQLYAAAKRIPWERVMDVHTTFSVHATVNSEAFTHSHYAALKVKDALVDRFREKFRKRPSVDKDAPQMRFDIHINDNRFRVSLDTTGDSLHRRGYRPPGAKAPLNEILAAAMLTLSGWQADQPLHIPMCGSGTLVMEAAMKAAGLPSQWFRTQYGFYHRRDFDKSMVMKIRQEIWNNRKPVKPKIFATDIERAAVKQTLESISRVSWEHDIVVETRDFMELERPDEPGVIILNPPYGERMRPENIEQLYRNIGRKLKDTYAGSRAWIISSNLDALNHVGFKHFVKHTLFNGQLECRYAGFELYEGSIKVKA